MKPTCMNLTTEQKRFFQRRKKQTGIPIAVQIRDAVDEYMKRHPLEA